MSTESATIHVVDDDASFRIAIGRLLKSYGYEVVLHESASSLLKASPTPERGCIVLDVQMPGISGPELQERLLAGELPLPIVFVTGQGDIPTIVKTIKAGAEDFLTKPVVKEDLFAAVERALARYEKQRELYQQRATLRALVNKFTPREAEVFGLVVQGKLNKQIAFDLGTSERTIKAHRHSIMEKLQVRSLAEAVSIAERLGLIASSRQT